MWADITNINGTLKMSRGPGRIQRELIGLMREFPHMTIDDAVGCIYHTRDASRSLKETVRRAFRGLVAKKIAERCGYNSFGLQCWRIIERPTLTAAQRHRLAAKQRTARKPRLVSS